MSACQTNVMTRQGSETTLFCRARRRLFSGAAWVADASGCTGGKGDVWRRDFPGYLDEQKFGENPGANRIVTEVRQPVQPGNR